MIVLLILGIAYIIFIVIKEIDGNAYNKKNMRDLHRISDQIYEDSLKRAKEMEEYRKERERQRLEWDRMKRK